MSSVTAILNLFGKSMFHSTLYLKDGWGIPHNQLELRAYR